MERRLLSRVSPFGTLHPPTCYPAQQELEVLMAKATAHPDRRLISSEDVQGTEVYGAGDQALGEIDHLLIEKVSGRVPYAVMSFGGFLGLGHSHYPIPWAALKYDTNLGGATSNSQQRKIPSQEVQAQNPVAQYVPTERYAKATPAKRYANNVRSKQSTRVKQVTAKPTRC